MSNAHIVYVWIEIIFLHLAFCVFFFMHAFQILGDKVHCLCTVHKYFIKKNIKNKFYDIIYIFKNYFIIIFLIFNKISGIHTNRVKY